MDKIASWVEDDRTARMLLAAVAEPTDSTTGKLVVRLGATETLKLATTSESVRGVTASELTRWRDQIQPRLDADYLDRVRAETERLELGVLIPGDQAQPGELAELRERAPVALWVGGDPDFLASLKGERLGIVGARAATAYGEHVASELANDLSGQGHLVVSGGAYGIDAAAHRAALATGRPTVAILPGGLDRYYPSGNRSLLESVAENGLVVSEAPPGAAPSRTRFLQRNRLVAAVSAGVVVVEAGYRSGALNTAAVTVCCGKASPRL